MTEIDVCPEISVLSSFLDEELAGDENRQVNFHIQNCPDCTGRLKGLQAADQVIVRNLGKSMAVGNYTSRKDCMGPETMTSYLHDLLLPEEKIRVEGHLDLCDACLSELTSLAKTEKELSRSKAEPLPAHLRQKVEALWNKGEKAREQILRVAVRLAKEGIEILRDSLFPQEVSFQEIFAPAGAYRGTTKGSLPSSVLVKRSLPGIQLSVTVEWEKEDRAGLKIKAEDKDYNSLEGRRVLLRHEEVLLYSERTDANGGVTISNLEPGVYQLGVVILEKEFCVDLEINRS